MNDEIYYSVRERSHHQLKIEGSKFLADVFPVISEEEAEKFLNEIRKKYFDATHHCFAYVVGPERTAYRYSDDGEPSGTAGVKIFSAIQSKNLSDILVVVTRYFGGTKLGVGGLGRAYFESAQGGLEGAVMIEKRHLQEITLSFAFDDTNAVMNLINKLHLKITSTSYTEEKTAAAVLVSPSALEHIVASFVNATHGRVAVSRGAMKVVSA